MNILRAGNLLSYEDVRDIVKDAARADRRTHQQLADALGVSRYSVSSATSRSGQSVSKMQIRLLELLTDYALEEGSYHRLIRKPKQ